MKCINTFDGNGRLIGGRTCEVLVMNYAIRKSSFCSRFMSDDYKSLAKATIIVNPKNEYRGIYGI